MLDGDPSLLVGNYLCLRGHLVACNAVRGKPVKGEDKAGQSRQGRKKSTRSAAGGRCMGGFKINIPIDSFVF